MKKEIKFYRMNMELPVIRRTIVRYYSELVYVEYDKPYSKLYFAGEKHAYTVETTLKRLMENLPRQAFFQCNPQCIINLCRYSDYDEALRIIRMDNGKELMLAHRRIAAFNKQKASLKRLSPLCDTCYTCTNYSCPDYLLFCSEENFANQLAP